MKIIPRMSKRMMGLVFNTRYRLAAFTRKSKTFNRIVGRMFFDGDDMIVVPKDKVATRTINTNIEIEDAGESTVLPSDVVKNLINRADDIFIMNFCICRKSNKCEDYPVDHGCVFMGKGVYRIPPEFGHLVTHEEACAYIDECGDLGFVHIIGRNKLDRSCISSSGPSCHRCSAICCPACSFR